MFSFLHDVKIEAELIGSVSREWKNQEKPDWNNKQIVFLLGKLIRVRIEHGEEGMSKWVL
jgi:hypothetical protein